MRKSVDCAFRERGYHTRAFRNGARCFRIVASSTVPLFSSGPAPDFDFAGSGFSPISFRNAKPVVAAVLLLVLILQPASPPGAGGFARFFQTSSADVGTVIQNWLFNANTLVCFPSPRSSNRQLSFVSTGMRMQVASVNNPRKLSEATVAAASGVAYEKRCASMLNTPLSARWRPFNASLLRS